MNTGGQLTSVAAKADYEQIQSDSEYKIPSSACVIPGVNSFPLYKRPAPSPSPHYAKNTRGRETRKREPQEGCDSLCFMTAGEQVGKGVKHDVAVLVSPGATDDDIEVEVVVVIPAAVGREGCR
jgi:hypothetical protein